jgi:CheY-like chemotaxis protein
MTWLWLQAYDLLIDFCKEFNQVVQSINNAGSGMSGVHKVRSSSPSTPGMIKLNQALLPHSRIGAPSMGINGFVAKKTQDPNTLKLLIAASEYAAAAMCRAVQDTSGVPSALPELTDQYVDIVFGLEVHFVFPNLSAEQRDLLVAIMKIRNSISAVLNGASRWRSAGEKAALENLAADLKTKFLELRSRIAESGIEERLDPVQKKVFQDEFFSITLDKTCSTTLFFRTELGPKPSSNVGTVKEAVAAGRSDCSCHCGRCDGIVPAGLPVSGEGRDTCILKQDSTAKPLIDRGAAPNSPERPIPGRKTVLLISDDPRAQELLGCALRPAGHNLLTANAGFTGYLTAMRERPDLVIVDLGLAFEISGPDACLDGKGVLKMLSQLPAKRALPFIGLAPSDTSETAGKVLVPGARLLQRPLDPHEVLGVVQNAAQCLPMKIEESALSN